MAASVDSKVRVRFLLGFTGLEIDGGIATVSRLMARSLEELTESEQIDGVDRVLLLDDSASPPMRPARGEQRLSRSSQARFIWQLWRLYHRHRHDLVIFDQVGLARSVLLPLTGFPPTRYAIFVHGMELERCTGRRLEPLLRSDLILVNSEFTAGLVERCDPRLAEKVRITQLCIDPNRVSFWESNLPPLSRGPRRRAALIVGRMWSEERGKGHDQLIEVWRDVVAEVPGSELWIVGGGDDVPRLEAKAAALAPPGSVRFLGRVSDSRLGELYREASVFAMPSRQEGFGLVYAEAMWHGLPCIGSTADAAGRVIADGETGVLVTYGDRDALRVALVGFLSDPDASSEMGRRGAIRAREQFIYERFRREFVSALGLSGPAEPARSPGLGEREMQAGESSGLLRDRSA